MDRSMSDDDLRRAESDHRLDCEHHPRGELRAAARLAGVRDLRVLVHAAPHPVPDEAPDDAEAARLDDLLHRVADVAEPVARLRLGDAEHHRLIGHLDQPFGFAGNRANRIHPAGIAIPALDDEGHVDIEDVALLQQGAAARAPAASRTKSW